MTKQELKRLFSDPSFNYMEVVEVIRRKCPEEDAKGLTWYTADGERVPCTVHDYLELIGPSVSDAPVSQLGLYRKQINEMQRHHMEVYSVHSKKLHALKERINLEMRKQKKFAGLVPVSATVVRNTATTKQSIMEYDEVLLSDGSSVSGAQIAEQYKEILATRPAGQIVDAVSCYVDEYMKNGPGGKMLLNSDPSFPAYVIRDTFAGFCEYAGIKGRDREKVKETLFPRSEQLVGPLGQIKMFVPNESGKKSFITMRFITARWMKTREKENLLNDSEEILESFEMEVNAALYEFLEAREHIHTGRGRGRAIEGFHQIPRALNHKVDRTLSYANQTGSSKHADPALKPFKTRHENYRAPIMYILNRWLTGRQNRRGDMVVPWDELSDRGLLAKHEHSTRRHRRAEDMYSLFLICSNLHQEDSVFQGCQGIEYDERNAIVFKYR